MQPYRLLRRLLPLLFAAAPVAAAQAGSEVRQRLNFDFDWKFTLSDAAEYADPAYDDRTWDDVQLPHDWNIAQEFDERCGGSAAWLPDGTGWYRKHFRIAAADRGKQVTIHFDAIFMQSDVYINGTHLGFRPYGFCSIEYDLTPYLRTDGGENVVAVRATTAGERPRWYAGGGIYRHVWLHVTDPVRIPTYGIGITTPVVEVGHAEVAVVTSVENGSDRPQRLTLVQRILDAEGRCLAEAKSAPFALGSGEAAEQPQQLRLAAPQLWSPDAPHLYTLETRLKAGGRTVDLRRTPFGVRTIAFDADRGFLLNGRPLKLQGLCLHQDAGSLGVAVPDRSYERRLEILKEYGCNALRCAHNAPSPEFLDLCDRLGFLVIDEAFDKWKSGYYAQYFDEWWERDLADVLLRDRNHPSIILWSIGNEVTEAWRDDDEGVERARMLQEFVHRLEPTRPVTLAAQNNHQDKFSGVTDVIGYNYLEARMLSDHKRHPERKFLVSEELPYFCGEEGNIRSYTPYNPWNYVADNDFIAGGFIWSGVDYLGEAVEGSRGWPNGLFDICMFEKPRAAYHRARWNPEPMVRIAVMDPSLDIDHGRDLWQWPKMAAHWNFPARYEGMVMELRTTTNCERVELLLNGKSMGVQRTADFTNHTIVWNLPYTPGTLEARGYNGEEQVADCRLVTSGAAAQLRATVDRSRIASDGQDLAHIAVALEDAAGNPVQTDDRLLTVTVEGDGRLLGLDNGDLRREKTFVVPSLPTWFGQALVTVQASRQAGTIRVRIEAEGIEAAREVLIETGRPM